MSENFNEVGDSILQFLVRAVNKENFNVELTLNVGGAIVTGTMTSAKDYFSALSERFEGGNEVAELLSEQFATAGEAVDTSEDSKAQFIHLKEAQVYCGDSKPTPSKGEVLWRGKLSEVDGFYLGKASSDGEEKVDQDGSKDSASDESNANERLDQLEESISELADEDDQKVESSDEEDTSKEEELEEEVVDSDDADEESSEVESENTSDEEDQEDEEVSDERQRKTRNTSSKKGTAKTSSSNKTKARKTSQKKD